MNKKVLQTVIFLIWLFFIGFSIIKIFFTEEFIAVITNEKLIEIGSYIDQNRIIEFFADSMLGILIMHFYLCSCKQVWKLNSRQYQFFITYVLLLKAGYMWNASIVMWIDFIGMLILPLLMRAKVKQIVVIFVLHQIGQLITLFLRSEPMCLASTDWATQTVLVFDMYVWLLLYYLYSNLYKEETLWDYLLHPFSEIRRKRNLKKSSKE